MNRLVIIAVTLFLLGINLPAKTGIDSDGRENIVYGTINASNNVLTNAGNIYINSGQGIRLGNEYRTNWPSSGGDPSNWSYYVAVNNVNLSNKELTNVAAMTLSGERRTNWPSGGTETDPIWVAVSNTVMGNAANGQTAYGWGNHTSAGYITSASNWSYYVAVSNVNLSNKELTNVAAMTLSGERRTTWPISGSGGDPSNWSYYVAISNVNLSNNELTNVAAMTLGGERRTTWPISTLRTTSDQVVNGTTLVDITGLTFAVSANTDYAFDFYITWRSYATTTGFRFAINGPAGAVVDYFITYQTIANITNSTVGVATWLQGHLITFDMAYTNTSTITAGVDLHCRMTGRIKVEATAGTVAARVGSELANTNLVVQKGSWGTYF